MAWVSNLVLRRPRTPSVQCRKALQVTMTAMNQGEISRISRGSREPQGSLKLRRSQRQLVGPQSSRKASEAAVRVLDSAERAFKEAETASMAAGRASEAAERAMGHLGVPKG